MVSNNAAMQQVVLEEYLLNENKELCISYSFAIGLIKTEKTVDSGLSRNRIRKATTWAHDKQEDGKVWIWYRTLPKETKMKVDAWFGVQYGCDIFTAWRNNSLTKAASEMENLQDATFFYERGKYTTAQVGDLIKAAGWLRWLEKYPDFWKAYDLSGKTRGLEYVAKLIGSKNIYGFKIGNNRVLERRMKEWQQMGLTCLISDKFGSLNAIKCLKDADGETDKSFDKLANHAAMKERILYLYGEGINLSVQQVASVYNQEAAAKGLPLITMQRVFQILQKNEMEWRASRNGANATRAVVEAVIKRKRPERPNRLWSLDGTTIQLYANVDEKVIKVGYWVMVVDACTDCVIGYAFGKTETTDLVLRALRMAVERAEQLPEFLQYDNGKANLSCEVQDLITNMKAKGLRAQPYNGKSKYVERIIGKIEQTFMRLLPNFVGGNITTRSLSSKANVDLLKSLEKADLYKDECEVFQEMRLVIETYNHTKVARLGTSPWTAYSPKSPKGTCVNELMIVALFWVKKVNTYMYRQEGLRMEINGVKHEYVVEDHKRGVESMEFRASHLGERFYVRYNPDNLDRIHLYDADDRHVAMAREKYEFSAIPTEGEMSILKEVWQNRKDVITDSIEKHEKRKKAQFEAGHEEVSFEMVNKEAYNAALKENPEFALLNPSPKSPKGALKRRDDEVVTMYDLDGVESGKVLDY